MIGTFTLTPSEVEFWPKAVFPVFGTLEDWSDPRSRQLTLWTDLSGYLKRAGLAVHHSGITFVWAFVTLTPCSLVCGVRQAFPNCLGFYYGIPFVKLLGKYLW